MADVSKTVEIIFGAQDKVSPAASAVSASLGTLGIAGKRLLKCRQK